MLARLIAPDRVLAVVAALLLPVAVVAPRMIPLLGAVAVAGLLAGAVIFRRLPVRLRRADLGVLPWLFLGLLAWAAVTAIWSPSAADSLETAAKMAAVAIGALVLLTAALALDDDGRARVGTALAAGTVLAVAFMIVDLTLGMPVTRLFLAQTGSAEAWRQFPELYMSRATSIAVLLCWPTAFVLYRRVGSALAAIFVAVLVSAVAQTFTAASLLAVVFGFGVLMLALWRVRLTASILATLCLLAALSVPALTSIAPAALRALDAVEATQVSARHRLIIWEFSAAKISQRPLTGWGMDAARHLGAGQYVEMRLGGDLERSRPVPVMSLHPHNGMVQAWLELGLPGIAAVLTLFLLGLRWLVRVVALRAAAAVGLATLAAGLTILQISYGLWQGWWQAAVWIVVALTVAVIAPTRSPTAAPAGQAPRTGPHRPPCTGPGPVA